MKKILLISILAMFVLQACYDEYQIDFDHTATYFALQKPLRTLVMQEGKELSMEVGVVVGGKYESTSEEVVNFMIKPDMLKAFPQLTLLPADYYTISDNSKFVVPAGEVLGKVTVTLNDKFINDPKSHLLNYALPLKITNTTTDSILAGKDSTIIAIKYQNMYYGAYWIKGVDHTLTATGGVASSSPYSNKDLVKNTNKIFSTLSKSISAVPYLGADKSGKNTVKFDIKTDGTLSVLPGDVVAADVTQIAGTGKYDKTKKIFTVDYNYALAGVKHQVLDTLYYFDTPLKVETW